RDGPVQYRAHMRQDKEKTPGVFGKEVDCVDEETWFNTKSASRTQKAQSRWKGEAGGPEEYLCLLCSACAFFVPLPLTHRLILAHTRAVLYRRSKLACSDLALFVIYVSSWFVSIFALPI